MKFITFEHSKHVFITDETGVVQGAIKCVNSFFDRLDKNQQREIISHLATGEDFAFEQVEFSVLPPQNNEQFFSWICFTAKMKETTPFEVVDDFKRVSLSLAYQYNLHDSLIQHAFESIEHKYLDEHVIQSRTSPKQLHFAKQGIVDTVRLTFAGLEIGYWTLDEWKEDPSLLGTILYSMLD